MFTIMSFVLKNGPPAFSEVASRIFEPYLSSFMRVFMDDFSVFGSRDMHLTHLRQCFERCRKYSMSLNPFKCAIAVQRGVLLGHILSEEGIQVDPRKIQTIIKAKQPVNLKETSRFVGQIKWHN